MKIAIDAGHGGADSGAIGNGLIEKVLTLKIANYLKDCLNNNGFTTVMTRTTDIDVPLNSKRTPVCDVSVSVHINAGGGQGLEVWTSLYNKPKESQQIGKLIHDAILSKVKMKDRGIKTRKSDNGNYDYYYMIRKPKGIPVLVELGFIDNAVDSDNLKNENFLKLLAMGITRGIKDYRSQLNGCIK